nr:unnamed protein product [Callosobruchus analis]
MICNPTLKGKSSTLSRNFTLYQDLEGKCGNAVILADTAYPWLRQVLTPYRDNGSLTATEKHFNKQPSKCRITIHLAC